MKILAVSSGKGGVGKTTITLNIARQLSLAGFRTLLIDFDIHNKGATCLFMDKVEQSDVRSVMSVMGVCCEGDCDRTQGFTENFSILDLGYGGKLFLIPAARPDEMVEWKKFVCETQVIVDFFRTFIQAIAEQNSIDVVLIDCYGGVDTLTISAAGVADDFLIINEPDVITFAGTLLLYKQLETTYGASENKPRVHFVINRITARHSFRFLQQEYARHLSQLAVDRAVLAYLPFDKLVFDNFGDYPFFSELLPKGLYARKIRELIARLWPEPQFVRLTARSKRRREKIYQSTAENPYADPERIFQVWKTAPGWALLPITVLILLYKLGATHSISYFALRSTFYVSLLFVATVVLVTILFEPWQITRWLLRKAAYERCRRRVMSGQAITSRARAIWSYVLSLMPAGIGIICFTTIVLIAVGLELFYPFRNLQIWRGQISGLHSHGSYQELKLHEGTVIAPRSDMSSSDLRKGQISRTVLPTVNLSDAHMESRVTESDRTALDSAELIGDGLDGAHLQGSTLRSADLSASHATGADFSNADCQDTKFQAADLSNANFTGARLFQTDFRHSNLRGAIFKDAIFKSTLFDGADLKKVDFSQADFTYIDEDRRAELFSLLLRHGAQLSPEQKQIADSWEVRKKEEILRDWRQHRKSDVPWWFYWHEGEPAHREDMVDFQIQILTEQRARRSDFATKADLIELWLIRGGKQDLVDARKELDGLVPEEDLKDDRLGHHEKGVEYLLRTLLSIITKDPYEQANLKNWRDWLNKNYRLDGWYWTTWDSCFPALDYSQDQNVKIRVLRLAATQELPLTPDQMMMWFPEASTSAGNSNAPK